jgi:hypothetical protein
VGGRRSGSVGGECAGKDGGRVSLGHFNDNFNYK